MPKGITNCSKCTDGKNKVPLTLHGTCDLKPVNGKGSCAIKAALHIIDTDVNEGAEERKPFKKKERR